MPAGCGVGLDDLQGLIPALLICISRGHFSEGHFGEGGEGSPRPEILRGIYFWPPPHSSLPVHLQTPGCDGILGSNRTLDKCGVCGGDQTACKLVSGNYSETNVPIGYHRILQIPAGATQIQVREMSRSPNYLGRSKTEDTVHLH